VTLFMIMNILTCLVYQSPCGGAPGVRTGQWKGPGGNCSDRGVLCSCHRQTLPLTASCDVSVDWGRGSSHIHCHSVKSRELTWNNFIHVYSLSLCVYREMGNWRVNTGNFWNSVIVFIVDYNFKTELKPVAATIFTQNRHVVSLYNLQYCTCTSQEVIIIFSSISSNMFWDSIKTHFCISLQEQPLITLNYVCYPIPFTYFVNKILFNSKNDFGRKTSSMRKAHGWNSFPAKF
jgi:hypothetical protein